MISHSSLSNWFRHLPRVARLTIRREILASIPLAVVVAVLAGPFCGFIGRKALGMSDSMLALLLACNMTGLLLVGLLIGFFNQKRKINALTITLLAISLVLIRACPMLTTIFLATSCVKSFVNITCIFR
jgi:hypothetical protein